MFDLLCELLKVPCLTIWLFSGGLNFDLEFSMMLLIMYFIAILFVCFLVRYGTGE
jgi:hypothetical protein